MKVEEYMFDGLIIPLLMMTHRSSDRDDIVMLTMKYDNFQEFVDEHEKHFDLLKVVTHGEVITNIVSFYINEQIRNSLSQYHHTWNLDEIGDINKVYEVIDKSIHNNKDKLLLKVKFHFKQIYDRYCENTLKSDDLNIFTRL